MRRRVVHLLDTAVFGGCEAVTLTLLAGLGKRGWDPVLMHDDQNGSSELLGRAKALGLECCFVEAVSRHNLATGVFQFLRQLRSVRPVIFHAHLNWPLANRHQLAAAKLSGTPGVVATAHLFSDISGIPRGSLKQRMQSLVVDRYIAVSDYVRHRFQSELGVGAEKLSVVKNGIDISRFDLSLDVLDARGEITQGRPATPVILSIGRLHEGKGYIHLIEALAMIPEAVLVLVGDGPERQMLEQRTMALGLGDRVRFLGQRRDVERLVLACDVFVLPSLYEAFGLSIIEAMAARRPIVATDVGGIPEIVEHDASGLLVPPRNHVALASAIRGLLSNKEQAARLAAAGRRRVESAFSSEAMVRGVADLYDELAAA